MPFASKAKAQWLGQTVPVMHACGHDAHVAILMGVAEILAGMREEIAGTVKFLFQPNEEGSYDGRPSGAQAMIDDGAFDDPAPTAVFGLHVTSAQASGADRAPARRADGERRQPQDRHPGPADARLVAVARRRSGGDGGADHPGAADHPQPPARRHADAVGADDLDRPWRRARQHHPRHARDAGHHPHPRRGGARRHLEAHREDRDRDRRDAGRQGHRQGPSRACR